MQLIQYLNYYTPTSYLQNQARIMEKWRRSTKQKVCYMSHNRFHSKEVFFLLDLRAKICTQLPDEYIWNISTFFHLNSFWPFSCYEYSYDVPNWFKSAFNTLKRPLSLYVCEIVVKVQWNNVYRPFFFWFIFSKFQIRNTVVCISSNRNVT